MSNTYKHKDLGRWKNGSGEITDRLNNLFDRHNFEVGERRAKKINIKESELKKRDNEILNNFLEFNCNEFLHNI